MKTKSKNKTKKNLIKKKRKRHTKINGKCYHYEKVGHMREDCRELIRCSNKAKNSLGKENSNLILCMSTEKCHEKENEKKKKRKILQMMLSSSYHMQTYHCFCVTKQEWWVPSMENHSTHLPIILGASCHVNSNDTSMYDIIDVDESVQGRLGSKKPTERVNDI